MRCLPWVTSRVSTSGYVESIPCLSCWWDEVNADGKQYHDDGEAQLGPTIVTLSLGCEGIMQIRMKKKFYIGATGNTGNKYNPKQPIVEGCRKPEKRREMNKNWSSWTQAQKDAAWKELKAGVPTNVPVCFHTKLRHGDYIVMHGRELQMYFEVSGVVLDSS